MKNASLLQRLRFAFNGVKFAMAEKSFRLQLLAAVFSLGALLLFGASPIWWAIFLLTIGSVLSLELVNTALEAALDIVHPNFHPAIARAKDCAAAAVLVMSLVSIAVFVLFLISSLEH
jgi:undecaprenol kinase